MSDVQNGWSIETLKVHTEALQRAEDKFHEERDRRYREVAAERDRRYREVQKQRDAASLANAIAERDRLGLEREVRKYKDEQANELREQIGSERGLYSTKPETQAQIDGLRKEIASGLDKNIMEINGGLNAINETLKPLVVYYNANTGGNKAITMPMVVVGVGLLLSLLTIFGLLFALYSPR